MRPELPCRTCPYVYKIRELWILRSLPRTSGPAGALQEKLTNKQMVVRKEVDDVLGGSEAQPVRACVC